MIDGAPDELLSGFVEYFPRVASFRSGTLLADEIPITSGRMTWTRSQDVPDAITFSVPRYDRGTDWRPGADVDHPLARFGQRVTVTIVVASRIDGLEYEHKRGVFRISKWQDAGDVINVTADGLLKVAEKARLTTPLAPRTSGTLKSEFRRLLPNGLSAGFDTNLVDRDCPQSMEWADDRLKALYEIADAWPARILVDGYGQIQVLEPLAAEPVPVFTFNDGEGGTLVSMPTEDTREGTYNVVVARSSATDQPSQSPIQAIVETTSGPMAVDTYDSEPTVLTSPLIENDSQARAAAQTWLETVRRPSRIVSIEAAPDPRIELDDAGRARKDLASTGVWAQDELGYVVQLDLPMTANDAAMRVDLGVG